MKRDLMLTSAKFRRKLSMEIEVAKQISLF